MTETPKSFALSNRIPACISITCFDHSTKNAGKPLRPVPAGLVYIPFAYAQWIIMMLAGVMIASFVSRPFALVGISLWAMGWVYNIPPLRTKEISYLDVLSESIKNPLRMPMGWYMITDSVVPPISLPIAYWTIGAYFMALKRFSEYSQIGDPLRAAAYRRSFRHHSEQSLLVSVSFYASAFVQIPQFTQLFTPSNFADAHGTGR